MKRVSINGKLIKHCGLQWSQHYLIEEQLAHAIWVMLTGAKSGGELVTLLSDRGLLLPSVI